MEASSAAALPIVAAPVAAGAGVGAWQILRVALAFALSAAAGLAVGLVLAMTVPQAFGYKVMTVLSGSMEPTLRTGGVVLSRTVSPVDAKLGDIVTFHDPSRGNELVTHRLRRIKINDGKAYMVTRGDANNTSERWVVETDGQIGRVVYHVPKLGWFRQQVTGQAVRLGVLAGLALLGLYLLFDIWRPRPRRG